MASGRSNQNVEPAQVAVDADRAAHQLDQLLRDGEPQAGPAVPAGGRGVGLGEALEDARERVGRDADPGVLDPEADEGVGVGELQGGDLDQDVAGGRELDRVPRQVHQHLPDPARVDDPEGGIAGESGDEKGQRYEEGAVGRGKLWPQVGVRGKESPEEHGGSCDSVLAGTANAPSADIFGLA